jgi:tRNA A37 threonylcarbamoyladenosine synthetase subunit TsaC/SUA5/YrdC
MQSNILIDSTVDGIKEASELLSLGKLVAFPTGLGANALNDLYYYH